MVHRLVAVVLSRWCADEDRHLQQSTRSRSSSSQQQPDIGQHRKDCFFVSVLQSLYSTCAMLTLLKFSTHDCQACQSMVGIDSRVAAGMGLAFIDVDLRNPETYRTYRPILLRQHPLKSGLALPSYLLVSDLEGDAEVQGEIVGAMPEQEFRTCLLSLMPDATLVTASAAPAGPGD